MRWRDTFVTVARTVLLSTILRVSNSTGRGTVFMLLIVFLVMCVVYYLHWGPDEFLSPTPPQSSISAAPLADDLHTTSLLNFRVGLGVMRAVSMFSVRDPDAITNEKDVVLRASHVEKLLPCYGRRGRGPRVGGSADDLYDFVVLPIGCFGDTLRACISCLLNKTLVNATYCGLKRLGLFLGDNFYPRGIRKWRDPRFKTELHAKFFRYRELQFTYYATSGNHDELPKFLQRSNPFWTMPAPFYTSGVHKSGDTTLEFFVISTNPYHTKSKKFCDAQKKWLNESLAKSTARWRVVVTHEPILDVYRNGPQNRVLQEIHILLVQHGIRLLVCAHTHGVFLHLTNGGYYQLVSAGFAKQLFDPVFFTRPLGYFYSGVGATALLFKPDFVKVVAVHPNGYLIFQKDIFLRNISN